MALGLTIDQQDLRDSVRDYCTDSQGADVERLWRGIVELGLTEIPFPERVGGAGSTLADTAVVVSELGRVLSPAPYLTSITAALFLAAGAAAAAEPPPALRGLVGGTRVGALVDTAQAPAGRITAAQGRDAGTVILDGVHETVLGADRADVLVVVVRRPDGPGVSVADAHGVGVHITPLTSLDTTRPLSRVELRGAVAVAGAGDPALLRHAEAARLTLFAAERVGAAERCLELALDHARRRHQFGRPIGSFQAVKHRLVDMHIEVELARSAVRGALEALDEPGTPPDQADLAAHIAAAAASTAFTFAAAEAIQVHGGIGFTWEFPLHHYFRRAKTTAVLMGAPDHHLTTITGLAAATHPPAAGVPAPHSTGGRR